MILFGFGIAAGLWAIAAGLAFYNDAVLLGGFGLVVLSFMLFELLHWRRARRTSVLLEPVEWFDWPDRDRDAA